MSWIAIACVAIVLCGGSITAVVLPPFQSWDEPHHFFRAVQIANGSFFPIQVGGRPGGMVDSGYVALALLEAVDRTPFDYSRKFDRSAMERAGALRLTMTPVAVVAPTVGYYFPTGYLAQALGLKLASYFTDRVAVHLIFARVMNCVVACALMCLALWICPAASPLLIAVAALPTSLFLFSTTSQDAC